MNGITEIDKAGRIVVPKKLRDALHLVPGTRLVLHQEGESIVLRQDNAANGLYKKQGLWVHHGPDPLPVQQVRRSIEAGRDEQDSRTLSDEPAL